MSIIPEKNNNYKEEIVSFSYDLKSGGSYVKNIFYEVRKNLFIVLKYSTYYSVRTFSKRYASKFNLDDSKHSISIKIGRINHALKKLGLISKYNNHSYKNLCKGDLINVLRSLKLQNDNVTTL